MTALPGGHAFYRLDRTLDWWPVHRVATRPQVLEGLFELRAHLLGSHPRFQEPTFNTILQCNFALKETRLITYLHPLVCGPALERDHLLESLLVAVPAIQEVLLGGRAHAQ